MKHALFLLIVLLLAAPCARAVSRRTLAGAAGATALLPLDDGRVVALVPAAEGGVGAYLLTAAGDVSQTLVEPNKFGISHTTCLQVTAPADGTCLWLTAESDFLKPNHRLIHVDGNGDGKYMSTPPVPAASAMSLQHLIPLAGERALWHDGDACTMQALVFDGNEPALDGEAFALPDDCGFCPAISVDGVHFLYPTPIPESPNFMRLNAYDRLSGQTSAVLENIGARQTYLNGADAFDVEALHIRAVRASQAGDVALLRWCNGSEGDGTLGVHVALVARDAHGAWGAPLLLDECRSTDSWRPLCGDFALSADGRLAVYAAPTSAESPALRVWRYDRLTGERLLLSGSLAKDCTGLEISPNGRYATFLCNGRAYCVDCGAQIRSEEPNVTVAPGATNVALPLLFHGLQVGETATLTLDAESACPGTVTVDGVVLAPGASVEVAAGSAVCFDAAGVQGDTGSALFRLVSAGTTSEVTLSFEISRYRELGRIASESLALLPLLDFNGDATSLLALSYDAFNGCEEGGLFAISLKGGRAVETIVDMESNLRVKQAVQAPFAAQAAWISNQGGLALDSAAGGGVLATDGIDGAKPPAVDACAAIVAAVEEGQKAIALFAKDGTRLGTVAVEEGVLSSPWLDYGGRVLNYLHGNELYSISVADVEAEPSLLATGVTQFVGATMDGARLLYRTEEGFFLRNLGAAEALRLEALPADATDVHLADNGCWISWHDSDGLAVARLSGAALDVAVRLEGTAGAAALAADGARLAFVGRAGDFAAADAHGTGIYLFETPAWTAPPPATSAWPADTHAVEEEDAILPLPYTGEAACLAEVRATAENLPGEWALLPPADGCAFTRLQWTPAQDFVGEASFEARFWNGHQWSEWEACTLTVDNVNDAPAWETAFPQEASVPQGGTQALSVAATDPDLANPQPDVLQYGLSEEAPAWAAIDSASGVLTLSPAMNVVPGEYRFQATVTDGVEVIQGEVVVTVAAAEAQQFTLDELLAPPDETALQEAPLASAAAWHAAVRGCWHRLVDAEGGWQALSLPGDVDCAALCALLGCDEIYRYRDGRWILQQTGPLPAGCAFWANLPKELSGGEIVVTPVTSRVLEESGFYGALVGETPPADTIRMAPEDGVWQQDAGWHLGGAVFLQRP